MNNSIPVTDEQLFTVSDTIVAPKGFMAGGVHAGLRRNPKLLDLGLLYSQVPATVAAVFTTNNFPAAPVVSAREKLQKSNKLQAILVNSAVANSGTGHKGLQNVALIDRALSKYLGIDEALCVSLSTGKIGPQLDTDKIIKGLEQIDLSRYSHSGIAFQQSILTTDRYTKSSYKQIEINNKTITIAGTAKGSRMINPNMATTLGFITTDASIEQSLLQQLLKESVDETFNAISVDGVQSTNDSIFCLANGMAESDKGIKERESISPYSIQKNTKEWSVFAEAFFDLCKDLALQIVEDGSPDTKIIEVNIYNAESKELAFQLGKALVSSSHLKEFPSKPDLLMGGLFSIIGSFSNCSNFDTVDVYLGPEKTPIILDSTAVDGYTVDSFDNIARTASEEKLILHVDLNSTSPYSAKTWGCSSHKF